MKINEPNKRILIDHGQYDHLNIGDVAMLQACAGRLYDEWPGAEIMVLTNSPRRLRKYCPETIPISIAYAQVPIIGHLPRPIRFASERCSKAISPYLSIARPSK